jgi:hypothetical protein
MTFRPNNSHERDAKGATICHRSSPKAEQVAGIRFIGEKMGRGDLRGARMLDNIRDSADRLHAKGVANAGWVARTNRAGVCTNSRPLSMDRNDRRTTAV